MKRTFTQALTPDQEQSASLPARKSQRRAALGEVTNTRDGAAQGKETKARPVTRAMARAMAAQQQQQQNPATAPAQAAPPPPKAAPAPASAPVVVVTQSAPALAPGPISVQPPTATLPTASSQPSSMISQESSAGPAPLSQVPVSAETFSITTSTINIVVPAPTSTTSTSAIVTECVAPTAVVETTTVSTTAPVKEAAKQEAETSEVLATPSAAPSLPPLALQAGGSPQIDKRDAKDSQMCSEYANEIFEHLASIENKYPVPSDYMKAQSDINSKMRAILNDWLVDVHLKFKLVPETLYLTINLIDRFLSLKTVTRQKLQLVGVSAMLLASKYEEIYAPEVKDFVYICARAYTREEILRMERLMLATLQFSLSVPTPFNFMKRYLKVAEADDIVKNLAFYFLDLSLIDIRMVGILPSQLAAGCIYLANLFLKKSTPWTHTLEHYSKKSEEQCVVMALQLIELVRTNEGAKLQAVKTKYTQPAYSEVAKIPALHPSILIGSVMA